MTRHLEEDAYLTIQLLSYDKPNEQTERYYFLAMSTLQATTLLPKEKKVVSSKIEAYTDDNKYLDERTISTLRTVGTFNEFFIRNPEYYIHNCEIEFEGGIILNSHDDGEVALNFPIGIVEQVLLDSIFKKYNLDKSLIDKLKDKPGHCIAIDKESNITGDYENFEDYLRNGRD